MGGWRERWSEGWVDVQRWMGRWREVEGRKNIFYLMTHSTHLIYGYMVSDHSDSEKGNPLPPHGLLFPEICGWIGRWRGGWERMGRYTEMDG